MPTSLSNLSKTMLVASHFSLLLVHYIAMYKSQGFILNKVFLWKAITEELKLYLSTYLFCSAEFSIQKTFNYFF